MWPRCDINRSVTESGITRPPINLRACADLAVSHARFGSYGALLLVVVIAGFIGHAIGIWASVLWGGMLIGGPVLN